MYIIDRRMSSASLSNRLFPARHGGDTGPRDLDEADGPHQFDELIDLADIAGNLENEALQRGIDHPGPESFREPQRLDPVVVAGGDLDHRQFALDRAAAQREIGDFADRDQTLQLVADLLDRLRRAGGHDGYAREMLGMGDFGDGQALDVVAAAGKQPDDAGKHARLV